MCNDREYMDAKPLFTSVETEHLDELNKGSELLAGLTIKCEHLQLIGDSLKKARAKHPKFCDTLTNGSEESFFLLERGLKRLNDSNCKRGNAVAEMILKEEMAEMFHAYTLGKHQEAMAECADCIAVLVRIMEELEAGTMLKM